MTASVQDTGAVRATIEAYISGSLNGDAALLRSIFHTNAVMMGRLGGQLMEQGPEPFYEHVAEAGKQTNYHAEIKSISVTGDTATACLLESGFSGLEFENHFHLIKIDAKWLITSKLFHHN